MARKLPVAPVPIYGLIAPGSFQNLNPVALPLGPPPQAMTRETRMMPIIVTTLIPIPGKNREWSSEWRQSG